MPLQAISPFELRKATLVEIRQEAPGTCRFLFRVENFPDFRAGQFNMLYVYGQGEVPISISSMRRDLLEHTVRLVGEVTEDLFRLSIGDSIGIRGPYGSPFPLEELRGMNLVLIAGGLGLADIKPVVEYVLLHREDYENVYLLVGAKNPSGLLYREEYESWSRELELIPTVDRAEGSWGGHVGLVTDLLPLVKADPSRTAAMMCGPEVMMIAVTERLLAMGLPEDRIFLSMERHMKCAVGTCGHCQFGHIFVCRDGPVFSYSRIKPLLGIRDL